MSRLSSALDFRSGAMLTVLVTFSASHSEAHDYWLAPTSGGDRTNVRLLVGDRLEPELERPLQKEITTRFGLISPYKEVDLLPALPDSTLPVFSFAAAESRPFLLIMDRDFVTVESTYEQFLSFLQHEENHAVAAQIKEVPGGTKMKRRYCRNLKALVRKPGKGDEVLSGRRVGQELEILLLELPGNQERPGKLRVQVLYAGEPLSGELVRVFLGNESGLQDELVARTSNEGMATFQVEHEGLWVIRVAHLRRCEDCKEADWDTFYATFSFEVP